jgi:hypothetical protein
MAYNYNDFKEWIFSDEGQRALIRFRDKLIPAISKTGAITLGSAIDLSDVGDSWQRIALVDRLVELGDLVKVNQVDKHSSQDEIYTRR